MMYVVETRFKPPYGRKKKLDYLKASRMLIKTNIVGMDDCDGYVRGWGTYRGMDAPEGTHQKGVTDMCEGGTYHGWVPLALMSVSLSKSPTQAYKGNENVLLIRISADQEMDAS